MKISTINHLIKAGDLNHHGTLFAGRTAEWFVEAGFIAAAELTHPENIVCLMIHGMKFSQPIPKGAILCFESRVVFAGRTSLITHIQSFNKDQKVLQGFITFVHVDENGRPMPHGLFVEAITDEERVLQEEARQLSRS
ncbi:MAG: acyl-CoA thioesterase [Chloroflexi bacterium]|nr:acyl-CoA thioesterase [Chloroflexota bacterium]